MRRVFVIAEKRIFPALLTETEDEQIKGLMGIEKPPVMCFPYKKAEVRNFWMFNTPAPLDILFLREGKIQSILVGEPNSTKIISNHEPTDLVIEMPYGTCAKYGIKEGDSIFINEKR